MVKLHSEVFAPLGNVVSEGVWNQLGRPELDRLTLLFREAIQNSWDARRGERIQFSIEGFGLAASQKLGFQKFFSELPPHGAYRASGAVTETIESLSDWLRLEVPRLIVISDRGTSGLDGPVRADSPVAEGATRNFVDFLRNVGQPPSSDGGGGTFGYGKAALYLASRCRTILVYTRCIHAGVPQTRLIAASLTHNFQTDEHRYTGRHWWGQQDVDGVVVPILDQQADLFAADLGLPAFGIEEFGTSIAITAPAFDDEELGRLDRIILRNLWPKLKSLEGGPPPVGLSIKVSGHTVRVPDPEDVPPYDAYWRAFAAVKRGDGRETHYQRLRTGRVAFEKSVLLHLIDPPEHLPVHEKRARHVALLRAPEIVVKYLDAAWGLGEDHIGFVGVFKADAGVDFAFAQSEPPTHDNWEATTVSDRKAKGIVAGALKALRKEARAFARRGRAEISAGLGHPLAELSREFTRITPGLSESVLESHSGPKPGSTTRKKTSRARAIIAKKSTVGLVEGEPHAIFDVDVTHAKGSRGTLLLAKTYPLVSGGIREAEPPAGSSIRSDGIWVSPRGTVSTDNPVRVGPNQQGLWQYRVPVSEAVAMAVEVIASKVGDP